MINEFISSDDKVGLYMKAILEIKRLENEISNTKKEVNAKIRKMKGILPKIRMTDRGYIQEYIKKNGKRQYVFQHRLVAEAMLGRELTEDEVIHHIDGNKFNNSPKNLIITDRVCHRKIHSWDDKRSKMEIFVENKHI